jgi:hypothetical protein
MLSNVITGSPTFGMTAVGNDAVTFVVLLGLLVLLTLIFRWAHRRVRNRELEL